MRPTDSRLQSPEARRAANRVLDVVQRERIAEDDTAADPSVSGPCIGAEAALTERAKRALMAYHGVDSDQAFEVLIGGARTFRSPVPTVAYTLLHGICEGDPQTEGRHGPLVPWPEARLRERRSWPHQLRTAPTRCSPAPETPRSG